MTLALEGIKVLDLTRLAPGPYCTQILADLGADVIKVEEHGPLTGRRAEQARGTRPQEMKGMVETFSPFNAVNRNKRSIALNLKTDEARRIFHKLAETADVMVEEFRPGVTKRLGIDYDTLKQINGGLIYCAITGYGQDGPYRDLVGHDINYISHAGALGFLGLPDTGPVIPANLLADYAGGGMHGAIGVMAALLAREKTGKGQFVDIAMTDGVVSLMGHILSWHFESGVVPERGDHPLTGGWGHYNVYETKDGKYISVGSVEPWFYANLCRTVGREDLIPHQFSEDKREEIRDHMRQAFRTKTRDEWFELLTATDICVGKVYAFDELASDPQLQHRKMIVDVDHPTAGKVRQVGISVKLSDTPGSIRRLAPLPGEHTEEVLKEAGFGKEEIEHFRAAGAIPTH